MDDHVATLSANHAQTRRFRSILRQVRKLRDWMGGMDSNRRSRSFHAKAAPDVFRWLTNPLIKSPESSNSLRSANEAGCCGNLRGTARNGALCGPF